MKHLKLMNEFCSWPLWNVDSSEYFNIDPSTLPISKKLQIRLLEWAKKYDNIMNWNDPASSGFQSTEAEVEFKTEGYEIAKVLKEELGDEYELEVRII